MPQLPMTVMRNGWQDLRVRPTEVEAMQERGYVVIGRVGRDGRTEYEKSVAEADMKRAIQERQERDRQARETAAAVGVPVSVADEMVALREEMSQAIDALRAENLELRERLEARSGDGAAGEAKQSEPAKSK